MNDSQAPGIFTGLMNAASGVLDGVKKLVSGSQPSQVAGRRRKSRKSRKSRRGGQPAVAGVGVGDYVSSVPQPPPTARLVRQNAMFEPRPQLVRENAMNVEPRPVGRARRSRRSRRSRRRS